MKLLSIVIPTYNTEQYLRRCLDSVLTSEVLPELEVLVVNDGSKDRSPEIAREYEARYPDTVTLIDKENGGHGSTINEGLRAATGKYFRVLDSDDWFDTCNFVKFFAALTMASSTYRTQVLRDSGLKLFEKCFYVDMMFNMIPIPYVKTVRFLDFYVYRYFMGSPTQSMSQQNLMRNLPNHEKVLMFLIDYYAASGSKVSDNVRNYMGQMIYFMYYTHMDLVCMKLKDRKKAYEMFRSIERKLRTTSPELYQRVNVFPYLRASRAVKYLNIRWGNRLFVAGLNYARRLLRRGE